ncbi:MAG: RluA family pseudouridine synthase [Nitrospirota bacterium]|nr:RluA family pseudouridine synthase [Nitrospirota bacterium]
MTQTRRLSVAHEHEGTRLDHLVAILCPDLSRSRVQKLVEDGHITIDDKQVKPSHKVKADENIYVHVPEAVPVAVAPQAIPLDILYEDRDIIVVNKPAGMVVHPAAGNYEGTLVNALLAHCTDLAGIGGELRPGIVHRLDKGTSGVMVVAKNDEAHRELTTQFRQRTVKKEYRALVMGDPPEEGKIELAIGRHHRDRKKMSARTRHGKEAVSEFKVLERFGDAALVTVIIATGRTHQIRVHMAHLGYPVAGDDTYGGGRTMTVGKTKIPRLMLHAARLSFTHPDGRVMNFEAEVPDDMKGALDALRRRGYR